MLKVFMYAWPLTPSLLLEGDGQAAGQVGYFSVNWHSPLMGLKIWTLWSDGEGVEKA